ncbi:MAG TPA: hypothetical protein VGC27_07565 [Rhizomicrobium sp.]
MFDLYTDDIASHSPSLNLPRPLELRGMDSHLTPAECAKERAKSKTESAAELCSKKEMWLGTPHKKVDNNYLAGLSGEAGRKAKTLVSEGDNDVLADSNSSLLDRGSERKRRAAILADKSSRSVIGTRFRVLTPTKN